MRKVYIAGKITGDPNYKERFKRAEQFFAKDGYAVLNPAALAEGMSPADYMAICLPMIFTADWVVFLPNWESSSGANIEYQLCEYISKQTVFVRQWPEFMEVWNEPINNGV